MSDDPTFQDTPLYAWLKANSWYLLGGLALFLAIMLYREKAPGWEYANLSKSWDRYSAFVASPAGLDQLGPRLAEARSDERVYPWMVYGTATVAAQTRNTDALALLKPELEALAKTSTVMVSGESGKESLPTMLLRKLYAGGAVLPQDPEAPEPSGKRIKITLNLGTETSYDVVFGLYEEVAPAGAAALLGWVSEGRFTEQTARLLGNGLSLTMSPLPEVEGEEAPPTLLVERAYGYFHSEGTLTTVSLPGEPGVQDQNSIRLLLGDNYSLDGTTTVLGKAVEGWEAFRDAASAADPTVGLKLIRAELLD